MSLATNLQNLATRVATEVKALRTLVNGNAADLSALSTTAKANLVAAINELAAELDAVSGGAGVAPATETVAGIVELATLTEATAGVDTTRAVTAAGVKAVRDALKTEILGAGVPEALDTLDELAAALGDDSNFAASVTTSLAGKQPLDATLTALAGVTTVADRLIFASGPDSFAVTTLTGFARTLLDDIDAAAARTTLNVYSKTEIGDPETDFVATFEAGLV
jgi:hypothetical protein